MIFRLCAIITFIMLSIVLFLGLFNAHKQEIASPLVGKSLPGITAKTLDTNKSFASEALKGNVWLLNVWATWCQACEIEYPLLLKLKQQQVPIVGLVYQDKKVAVGEWLSQHGQAFINVLLDKDGNDAINLGVYGAPETFLIDKHGVIRYKHIGILSQNDWLHKLKPLYERLKG